jgi:hypothetical protein
MSQATTASVLVTSWGIFSRRKWGYLLSMGLIIRHLSATVNVADNPKQVFPSLIRHPPD